MFKCDYKGGQSSLFLFCSKGGDNDVEKIRQNAVKVRFN